MSLSPATTQKLMREFRSLTQSPPEGIRIHINDDNIANIHAEIDGPVGTPFEGGLFRVKLVLGSDFPASPPKAHFLTKLFHPNVSSSGEICVNTLKKDWDPSHGIKHVLLVIRCLLIYPNPESALNQEAGKLLLENYEDYQKRATLMTRIHAKPKQSTNNDNDAITTATATSATGTSSTTSTGTGTSTSTPTSTGTSTSNTSTSTSSSSIGEKENTDTKLHTNRTATTVSDSPAKKVKLATATTTTTSTAKPMMDKEAQAKLLKKKSLKRL